MLDEKELIMLVLSFDTKKDQKTILKRAIEFFVERLGLRVSEQGSCCVKFVDQSKLGFVNLTLNKKIKSLRYGLKLKNMKNSLKNSLETLVRIGPYFEDEK
jgi:hypothetical protein